MHMLVAEHPFRLAWLRVLGAAAAAALLWAVADTAVVVAAAAIYATSALLLALLDQRSRPGWAPYAGIAVDAVALAGLTLAAAEAPLPAWTLGLLALSIAASAGVRALVAATLAVALAVAIAVLLAPAYSAADALLSSGLMLGIGAGLLFVLHRFLRAEREAAEWRAYLRGARSLHRAATPEEILSAIATGGRGMAHADAVRLWRRERTPEGWRLVAGAGDAELLPASALPGRALAELAEGKGELARPLLSALPGRARFTPLPSNGTPTALLGVAWRARTGDRRERARLHRLAEWASDALLRAQNLERQAAARDRANVLREALIAFAASTTVTAVEEAALTAVRLASGARAAMIDKESEQVRAGSRDLGVIADDRVISFDLVQGRVLRVALPVEEPDLVRWLEEFVTALRTAIDRTKEFERLSDEACLLQASVEWLPAPVVVQDAAGKVIVRNRAFRKLAIDPPAADALEGHPFEVASEDPARQFVAATARIDDTRYVTLYREVTQERAALSAKDELIATMGHELRTPLTSVRGYSQMMGQNLEVVREQIARLDAMIEDFVHSTRPGAGTQFQREIIDPAALVEESVTRFHGAWEGRELDVSIESAPRVLADPGRLGQVLDNLLGNAAKFSPPNRPIEVTLRSQDGRVVLAVLDHGEGIHQEHLPRLFERGYRVPGTSKPGQGLGLAIVRDLVEAHGGEVRAESAGPGRGSTFYVTLPAAQLD